MMHLRNQSVKLPKFKNTLAKLCLNIRGGHLKVKLQLSFYFLIIKQCLLFVHLCLCSIFLSVYVWMKAEWGCSCCNYWKAIQTEFIRDVPFFAENSPNCRAWRVKRVKTWCDYVCVQFCQCCSKLFKSKLFKILLSYLSHVFYQLKTSFTWVFI